MTSERIKNKYEVGIHNLDLHITNRKPDLVSPLGWPEGLSFYRNKHVYNLRNGLNEGIIVPGLNLVTQKHETFMLCETPDHDQRHLFWLVEKLREFAWVADEYGIDIKDDQGFLFGAVSTPEGVCVVRNKSHYFPNHDLVEHVFRREGHIVK